MYSHTFVLASALVAGTTMAQSTSVTSLFLYGFEGDNIVASVISAAPEATSYFVNCAEGTDGSDCGFGPGVTFVNGPSTVALHVTESESFTMDTECKVTSEIADCVQTVAGPGANDPGVMSTVVSDLTNSLLPVTITAGLDKILAGDTATATDSSAASGTAEPTGSAASGPSETGSSASMTGMATSATGTSTSASSTSASNSTATNGAVAGAGQNLVLAGLSGMLGLMMAL